MIPEMNPANTTQTSKPRASGDDPERDGEPLGRDR